MQDESKFWDGIAEKYARSPVRDVESWDETLRLSRQHLQDHFQVLEFGAGTGSTALRMHDAAARYRATDISANMIAIAKEKQKAYQAPNLEFAHSSIFEEPANQYDAILAYNVLHLVDDLPKTLAAVHRALKDDGVFISKSGCVAGKYAALRVPIGAMQMIGKAPHVNYFSAQKLENAMVQAGFEITEAKFIPQKSMTRLIVARKKS